MHAESTLKVCCLEEEKKLPRMKRTKKDKKENVGPTGRMRTNIRKKRKEKGGREEREGKLLCVFGLTLIECGGSSCECGCGKMYSRAGPASHFLFFFFLSFFSFFLLFGRGKRSSYVETYQKSEKRYTVRIKNSLFLCHKCNILPSYLS